ncbi:MAG: WecB/TagA/CpsF family glycosyltransferase [Pseudomonadota bacterium]
MTTAPYESLAELEEAASALDVERVNVAGLPLARMTRDEQARYMVESWRAGRAAATTPEPKIGVSINGHVISLYYSSPEFKAAVDQVDFLDADGMSVVFASRLFGRGGLPERVATTDFFHDVARRAETAGMSFYFLGADEDQCRIATEQVRKMYPNLRIAGRRHGYFTEDEEAAICEEIVAAGTDLLWVGRGSPSQEQFAVRNRDRLKGVAWIKTCGGLFDFLSGKAQRAPQWMQDAGLEFVYRAWREPRRLLWRYITTSPHALYLMAKNSRNI